MITPNTTFVAIPDTEVAMDAKNPGALQYLVALMGDGEDLLPTEAGHAYIADQIFSAETITIKGLKGDVNLDGRVSAADTALLFDYVLGKEELNAQQLYNADVTEDDRVSAADTTLLFDYVLGKAEF